MSSWVSLTFFFFGAFVFDEWRMYQWKMVSEATMEVGVGLAHQLESCQKELKASDDAIHQSLVELRKNR